MDVLSLISLCKTVLSTGSQYYQEYRKKQLTDREKELLIAASQSGEFRILSVDQLPGSFLMVGSKEFVDENDPAQAALYLDAFQSLIERGFIRHENGVYFMLTGSGFTTARELESKLLKIKE